MVIAERFDHRGMLPWRDGELVGVAQRGAEGAMHPGVRVACCAGRGRQLRELPHLPAGGFGLGRRGPSRAVASNAPLSQLGNKRVIAALLEAEGQLSAEVERELIELRRASFAAQDMREGMKAFAEKRAPQWRGE